jgi:hypothetical protein
MRERSAAGDAPRELIDIDKGAFSEYAEYAVFK